MSLKALIFDVDGTLADTEEAHRQAFNTAFVGHQLDWVWDRSRYSALLEVSGGKERIAAYINSLPLAQAEKARLYKRVAAIHADKTRVYAERVSSGQVPLRPGVARLIDEARTAGIRLAIASTTTRSNIEALIAGALGEGALAWFSVIACGDQVLYKKPAPDIYLLALSELQLAAECCIAFEDSAHGMNAARAAGLFTVVTPTVWTAGHDFSQAQLVIGTLDELCRPNETHSRSGPGVFRHRVAELAHPVASGARQARSFTATGRAC